MTRSSGSGKYCIAIWIHVLVAYIDATTPAVNLQGVMRIIPLEKRVEDCPYCKFILSWAEQRSSLFVRGQNDIKHFRSAVV